MRASGSAVTHRGDDVVSGRMMPTLAPLPSTAPLEEAPAPDGEPAALEEEPELLSLLDPPQPARAIARVSPTKAIDTLVLRMR